MARLRKLGRVYYARIRITTDEKQSERCINLGTREKAEASRRLMEIHRMEPALREGENFEFSWEAKDKVTKVKRLKVGDAVAQYLKARKNDLDAPLRESSLEMIDQSFNRLKRYLKWGRDIESLAQADIDGFKHFMKRKEYADATINITVRNLRTWYEWMKRTEIYEKPLVLKQIPIRGVKPIYVSNAEFELILNSVDDYLKRVFNLYRETGMRAKEPILGEIVGSFLIVSPENSKSGREREVYLTQKQIMTVREMQRKTHIEPRRQGADPTTHSHMYFTRQFKAACRKNGIKGKRLHSLRHTYALRAFLKERDLYSVAKKMGHSSLSVTMTYASFSMRRLAEDFPDIITHERGL